MLSGHFKNIVESGPKVKFILVQKDLKPKHTRYFQKVHEI